jgi:hypothetical protein
VGTARRTGALALSCLGGVLAALALGTPAYAEDADLRLEIRTGQLELTTAGQPQTFIAVVTNDGPSPVAAPVVNFQAPLSSRGVTVASTSLACSPANGPSVLACPLPAMNPGQSTELTIQLAPPGNGAVAPGENVNEDGNAWVTNPAGGDPNNSNDGGSFKAVLRSSGSGVTEVAGSVVDGSSGQPLAGATVEVTDSGGASGQTTTDNDGRFVYRPDPQSPLHSGRITIKASKAGYDTSRTTVNTDGGSINDIKLAVSPAAAASPTPPPSPTAAPSSAAAKAPAAASNKSDDSSVSLLVVILVSVLATGILTGAALWVGLRRNREQEPATAGANLGDAPTVQLRMPNLGPRPGPMGGTQVMPPMGDHDHTFAVDATQQIPAPDSSQLIPLAPPSPFEVPPAGQYDQTAPFGPPTARLEEQTTAFSSAPGASPHPAGPPPGLFAPLPDATTPSPVPPPYSVPPSPMPSPVPPSPMPSPVPLSPVPLSPMLPPSSVPPAPRFAAPAPTPFAAPPPGARPESLFDAPTPTQTPTPFGAEPPVGPVPPVSSVPPTPPPPPGPPQPPPGPPQPRSVPPAGHGPAPGGSSWFDAPSQPTAAQHPDGIPEGHPLSSQSGPIPPISALTSPTGSLPAAEPPRPARPSPHAAAELRAAMEPPAVRESGPLPPVNTPTDPPFLPPSPQRVPPYLIAVPQHDADQSGRHADPDLEPPPDVDFTAPRGRHSTDS